jgi:lysophospholipase L1-like esterase
MIFLKLSRLPALAAVLMLVATTAFAQSAPARPGQKWVASWAASVHGPYPSGNPSAQPELKFAFPAPEARDQTFRLIVRPDLWGARVRLRFANTFGTQPVAFDEVHLGLQATAGTLAKGSNRRVTFGGKRAITVAAGQSVWSDPVDLPWVKNPGAAELAGRKLAVSFHVPGPTGPMTWHAKALTTSYVSPPGSGAHSAEEGEDAFPFTTTSWYFLDAVDVMAPADTVVVCAFGDSITDGTNTTLNGDDRWPDVLSRRLHAAYGTRVSVVNEGIGGNQVLGPATYGPETPFAGGPSALSRLDRDVLALSGLSAIVWLEGINDFGTGKASAEAVIDGMQQVAKRVRAKGKIRIVGATLTSSLNSTNAPYASPEVDEKRQALNRFIRTGGVFDGVADFDAVTIDPASGALKPEFQPNSTVGGPGDLLHPNRAGYQAMGNAIDLKLLMPSGAANPGKPASREGGLPRPGRAPAAPEPVRNG